MLKLRRVLVVDDEEIMRDMMRDVLTHAGFEVTVAADAEQALAALAADSYAVMFFDLMLPGRNGLELCAEVRRRNPISVIYAMTGKPHLFEVAACRGAGFDDYFPKPFDRRFIVKAAEDGCERVARWTKGAS
ncbi:MAG: response regulator [Planctomycetota bacterium]|nr:response regulator [Planctomycetota bacterium]